MGSREITPPQKISWSQFLEQFVWFQGEHVTLIGPTGCGKTTLALAILPRRKYQIVVATKPEDPLLDELKGYKLIRNGELPPSEIFPKVIYWPPVESIKQVKEQGEVIGGLLENVYVAGKYCLYFDEVRYVTNFLKLAPLVEVLWLQGRSLKVSLVAATQRPRGIPLTAYSQATHLFLWRDSDAENLKRLSELGAADVHTIRYVLPRLAKHDVLYVNTRTGDIYITKVV